MLLQLALGIVFSAIVAGIARARGSLDNSGALAAVAIGSAIYFGGGPAWFAALLVFFITSSLLGKLGRARKADVERDYQKGQARDAMQALCNAGVAALCALFVLLMPSPWTGGAFLGALASANGDTWATELGVLSRGDPRSLLGFKHVPRGSSGAVSGLGLLATLAGGLAIGLVGALAPRAFGMPAWVALCVGGGAGLLGSLLDSLLGASLQAGYHCPACARDTETAVHHCGTKSELKRGLAWFDNDTVNLLATLFGAFAGGLLEFLLEPPPVL
jgi:uncharacterized protein (TIGR00297 family)